MSLFETGRGLVVAGTLVSLAASGCDAPSGSAGGPPRATGTAPVGPATTDPATSMSTAAPTPAASAAGAVPDAQGSPSGPVAPAPAAAASASAAPGAAAPAEASPCPTGMALVPGGTFARHKPREKKRPTVGSFCLDRTEVTVIAYKECVKEKKCSPRCLEVGRCSAVPADADWPDTMETIRASMFCNGSKSDRDAHPVNCVSFDEARGYCEAYGKRLPTGDEWEWAIVADRPAPVFPWGRSAPTGDDLCWGKPFKRSSTCVPGTYARDVTRDGVVDMAGNLSEWVVEGSAAAPRRGLRGASWYSIDDGYVQASMWGFDSTSTRSEVFGFRCAKDASAP